MVEELVAGGHHVTIFFYNPNIHPREEYEIRKEENKRFAERIGTPFVDADYDVDEWFKRARGMEFDPERGRRCTMCFDMRMERTAYDLHLHPFSLLVRHPYSWTTCAASTPTRTASTASPQRMQPRDGRTKSR